MVGVGEEVVRDVGEADCLVSAPNTYLPLLYGRTYNPEPITLYFMLQWTGLSLYAFLPFPILTTTLVKIKGDEAEELIVIACTWLRRYSDGM